MDLHLLLVTSVAVFAATLFQTIAGFGYAIIGVPLLSGILGIKETVVFLLIGSIYMRIYVVFKVRKELEFDVVKRIFFGAMVGIVPGSMMLRSLDGNALRIVLGVTLILAVIVLRSNYHWKTVHDKLEQFGFGIIGGFFNGSTSVGGPPIVLYMLNSEKPKEQMRANLFLYFLMTNIFTIGVWLFLGNAHLSDAIGLPLWTLPAAFLGIYAGEKIFCHINQQLFNRIAVATILLSGLNMIYKGLML
jgi:uncharacterized protein